MQTPTAAKAGLSMERVQSIDLLRGLIMVIMALDHVRDYFHAAALEYDPLDLNKTTAILFFTRWITHYCAPIFMFLSGVSAFLSGAKKTKKELSLFLLKRGLWLVLLEFTLVKWGWYFNLLPAETDFIVIWALGVSMIVLAVLVHFPRPIILAFGIILVCGHNLLDTIHVEGSGWKAFGWALLHDPNMFVYKHHTVVVLYPLIPWIGVMGLGYCLGSIYAKDFPAELRKKILFRLGWSLVLSFVALRASNIYGDRSHWSSQASGLFTVLSFLKTSKYPPSLLYLLMTLGPALIFLSGTEARPGWLGRKIAVYGRVPMFYYLCHIYLLHLLAMVAAQLSGYKWSDMIFDHFIGLDPVLKGYGFSLGVVYLVWMLVVLLLYPLCRRYDEYKRDHKDKWWVSYL